MSELYQLTEASRNELLALAKSDTITRYNKSVQYKGFSIVDIDTTSIFKTDTITVTCKVGDYYDTVEMNDILIWIQMEAERNDKNQVNTKAVTQAIMEAIDALEIKVNCTCPDFCLEENTLIKLLNGEVVKVKDLKTKFDKGEELWVYSTDDQGDFRPGKVKDVWITGQTNKMIKVTLDNGKEIITTPNHKYMMRDGSYKEARDLKYLDSLMPLYFRYTNGYENVKLNSKKITQYHSVYKIVANTLLEDKIEEARARSGEDIIQIHHKDFNKLNNYPSNLEPKGKMEHWMYHAKLGGDNIQAFIEGGRKFWKESPKRFEAKERQRKAAQEYQLNMWKNFTPEEKEAYVKKSQHSQNKGKLSKSLKVVWNNYSNEEKEKRLNTSNNFRINNPMKDKEFLNSNRMIERNKKISQSNRDRLSKLTDQEKSNLYGWAKGKTFSTEHKNKISNSLKGRIVTEKTRQKLRDSGKRQAQQNKETRCLRNINELIALNIEITPETFLNNRRPGDPHFNKVFNNFEEMLNQFGINYNHKVVSIEEIIYDHPINVYDIEVEDYHNFYVDAGVVLHNCYRFAYQATQLDYKYGKPENRPANITNPHNYGSMCFVGDTLVLTEQGLKPIKDIKVGDKVFTHKGRLKEVLANSHHYENKLIKSHIGMEDIISTENHPFYITNKKEINPEWKSLRECKWKDEVVLSPKLQLSEDITLPKGYAFMLGLFLSDGHVDIRPQKNGSLYPNQLTIALDKQYKQLYIDKMNELGIQNFRFKEETYGYDTHCINLQIYDKDLKKFIINKGGYTYKDLHSKFLSEDCFKWSKQDKLDLINGFFWGDGQFGATGKKDGYLQYILYNSNKDIMQKLYILIRSFTYAKMFSMTKKPFYSKRMKKIITPCEHYLITIRGEHIRDILQPDTHFVKTEYSFSHPISSYKKLSNFIDNIEYYKTDIHPDKIQDVEGDEVYNLKVADDESYLVTRELYAVHNCKHLIAMLSNKKWLQQITGTIMDFIEKNIDRVNQYLRPKEGMELTLPDELARQNAKKGFWSKFANRQEQLEEIANDYIENNSEYIMKADIFNIKNSLQTFIKENFEGAKLQNNEINVIMRIIEKYKEDNTKQNEPEENIENNNEREVEDNNE